MTATLLLCLGLPALAAAETPTWERPPTRNQARKHVMVQFTDMSLHPSSAQVVQGGTVSWVNYASMYEGSIVSSEEVAWAFTCSDLRPNWMKTGTGYRSIPITMGGATDDLEMPCPLKPGAYEYEFWLFSKTMGNDPGAMDDPRSRMQGKVVVR
jgi:plastocyanin